MGSDNFPVNSIRLLTNISTVSNVAVANPRISQTARTTSAKYSLPPAAFQLGSPLKYSAFPTKLRFISCFRIPPERSRFAADHNCPNVFTI